MHVCVDFRYLNTETPKDEYLIPIADMLIDSTTSNEILSSLDDFIQDIIKYTSSKMMYLKLFFNAWGH